MSTRIKLLHLINNFSDASNNRIVLELAKELAIRENYEFHVGGLEKGGGVLDNEFRRCGANVVNFDMKGYHDFRVLNRIGRYIIDNQINVVHTHILKADIYGGIATIGTRATLVATKHNEGFFPGQLGWLWRTLLYNISLRIPEFLITVSDSMRNRILSEHKLRPEQVVTIHNGIDIQKFHDQGKLSAECASLRVAWGLSTEDFVVGYIGRVVNGKGLIDLLKAIQLVVASCERCYLVVVGTGPLLNRLISTAKDLGIKNKVIFTGYRSDVPAVLAELDVFVLPSLSEGFPISILEAMATEKAVIATPVGGIKEVIHPGETGILVAPKDPEALANAILSLVYDKKITREIGKKAKELVETSFDVRVMCKKYDMFYQMIKPSLAAE